MKWNDYFKKIIFLCLVLFCFFNDRLFCEKLKKVDKTNIREGMETFINIKYSDSAQTDYHYSQFLNYIYIVFVNGIYDKAFLFTIIFSLRYSKMMVFSSVFSALALTSFFSQNITHMLNVYFDYILIDIFCVVFFIVIGLKMFDEALEFGKIGQESINMQEHYNFNPQTHSFSIINQHDPNTETILRKLLIRPMNNFFLIFMIIFISEIGDKSQINSIYIPKNSIKALYAIILAHFLLTIAGSCIGYLLSSKISQKAFFIILGSVMILFSFISLGLTFYSSYYSKKPIMMDDIFINHTNRLGDIKTDFRSIIPSKNDLIQDVFKM
jgi:putative Ca2+/H+ antiporter (TMEM165/GDT1 family)